MRTEYRNLRHLVRIADSQANERPVAIADEALDAGPETDENVTAMLGRKDAEERRLSRQVLRRAALDAIGRNRRWGTAVMRTTRCKLDDLLPERFHLQLRDRRCGGEEKDGEHAVSF